MIRLLAFTLATAAATTAAADNSFTAASSFSGPNPAVVRVAVPERDGASLGSGTLVAVNESSGLVLTNWHVVRDAAGPIVVIFPDGFRSGAYVLRTDRDWDLAALAIRRPNVQPIPIASEVPRPGEELTIAGYGSGSYRAVTGRLTQYVSPGGNHPFEMIELSAPARNGDSGGPIFNNRGELAGTLFGSSFGRTTGSYCGRLRWFVGAVNADFERISAQAMLAQQSRRNPPVVAPVSASLPVAPEPAPATNAGPYAQQWQPSNNPPAANRPEQPIAAVAVPNESPTPSVAASPPAPQPNTAASVAVAKEPQLSRSSPVAAIPAPPPGSLPKNDYVRSLLALVGALALLYHAVRFVGWAVG